MSKQPIEFMFSPYRRQVLAVLFLRPDEQFHVRQLERMTGVSAGSLLQEALSHLDDQIQVAIVFGSMASGHQTAGSDLDICVLGEVSLLEVVKALSPVQETLRREVNPVVMTPKKFSDLSGKKDRFATRSR